MNVFISQPMIGKTTEEILKEYREVVDWCEDTFYKNNDIKFINPLIPPLSPYKDELLKWFLMVDAAVFTKGWKNEKQCVIEHQICSNYEITIYELNDYELSCRKETKHDVCFYLATNGTLN